MPKFDLALLVTIEAATYAEAVREAHNLADGLGDTEELSVSLVLNFERDNEGQRVLYLHGDKFIVSYASAGCLPDSEPVEFDSLEDAAHYVVSEHDEVGYHSEQEGGDETPILMAAQVIENMGADDPRSNSLYRWSIERVVI